MDFKDLLETIVTAWGWGIVHARRDYQNLQEIVDHINSEAENYSEGETFVFLDPIKRDPHDTGYTYGGQFMVLTNADLADDYQTKYDNYIAPVIDKALRQIPQKLRCDGDVQQWSSIEVINALDLNGDGLSITYKFKGEGFPVFTLPVYMTVYGADNFNGEVRIDKPGLGGQTIITRIDNGRGLLPLEGPGLFFEEGVSYVSISVISDDATDYTVTDPIEFPFTVPLDKNFRVKVVANEIP